MIWKPVVGFEGIYDVSENGDVRRLLAAAGTQAGRLLSPSPVGSRRQYLKVELRRDGRAHTKTIHRLVAEAFIARPTGKTEVCHKDGNPHNNNWRNLRWDSHRENQLDTVRLGKHHYATRTHCKHGHEFNDENTLYPKAGGRACRTCGRISQASYQRRKRAIDRDKRESGSALE